MTKAEVRQLTDEDDKLQWWAAVLFAEICDLYGSCRPSDVDTKIFSRIVQSKVDEFPKLVIARMSELCKERATQRAQWSTLSGASA